RALQVRQHVAPEVRRGGIACRGTMGSPAPTSTYAISLPRTRRRCFLYGNAAEITFASPVAAAGVVSLLFIAWEIAMTHSFQVGGAACDEMRREHGSRGEIAQLHSRRVGTGEGGSGIRLWANRSATSGQ